jgi:hypothetical protein
MQRDCLGNMLTGEPDATLKGVNEFIEGFLAYETRAEGILGVADADPESCQANVYAGLLWMLLESPEAGVRAAKYLKAAELAAPLATRREQLNAAVLRAWTEDDVARAILLCEELAGEFPRDLPIVKVHQYLEFNRGNARGMLRVARRAVAAAADVPYAHGMLAFALEECHLLEQAEAAAHTALAMRRKEPWAQHALAHVLLTRGQVEEGVQFLDEMADTWISLNSFMFTHLWWHQVLFYLRQGREADALRLYDGHCWGVAKHYSQDQIGAVSLLARFELAGMDVGARWEDVADHLEARATDTVQPFLTLQYLYGLARAGRPQAQVLLDAVREYAPRAPAFSRTVWMEVALPGCEGLFAYARGDHDSAFESLAVSVPRMSEAGGSHAQRDLFDQILKDAARRSGRSAGSTGSTGSAGSARPAHPARSA